MWLDLRTIIVQEWTFWISDDFFILNQEWSWNLRHSTKKIGKQLSITPSAAFDAHIRHDHFLFWIMYNLGLKKYTHTIFCNRYFTQFFCNRYFTQFSKSFVTYPATPYFDVVSCLFFLSLLLSVVFFTLLTIRLSPGNQKIHLELC